MMRTLFVCLTLASVAWVTDTRADSLSALVGQVALEGQPGADLSQAVVRLEGLNIQTRVDGQNRFRFEGLRAGRYAVHAVWQGAVAARREDVKVKGNETRDIGVLLLRPAGAVSGHAFLTGTSDHQGIEIRVPGTNLTTKTNPDGSFLLDRVPTGLQSLWASKFGYIPVSVPAIQVQSGQTTQVQDVTLVPVATNGGTATLNGTVKGTTPSGPVPLEGAEIKLTSPNSAGTLGTYTAETDVDGAFEITGLPSGSYKVEIEGDHYAKLVEPIFLAPGQTLTREFLLRNSNPSGTGIITGHVAEDVGDLALYKPIENAEVFIRVNGAVISTRSDVDGRYKLGPVPPGQHAVNAVKPGYAPQSQDVDVPADGNATAEFRLVKVAVSPGCMTGTVFAGDANTTASPLANAHVWLYPAEAVPYWPANAPLPPSPFHGISGPDGAYRIDNVPPGQYLAVAATNNLVSDRRPVVIPPNNCIQVNFFLRPTPPNEVGRVEGTVTEDAGMLTVWIPIADALVVINLPNGINLSTHTNSAGEYFFPNVPVGAWPIRAVKPGYENQDKSVDVAVGESSVVNFQLKPLQLPRGNVAGNVKGVTGGVEIALEGAEVVLVPMHDFFPAGTQETEAFLRNHPPSNVDLRLKTETDVDGNFAFGGVPAGPYLVGVHARGYVSGHQRTVVESDATATVEFVLDALTFGAVAGTVTESTASTANPGEPIANALLALVPSRGSNNNVPPPVPIIDDLSPDGPEGLAEGLAAALMDDLRVPQNFLTVTSADDGSYSFPKVPSGEWCVVARARGYFRDIKCATVQENLTSIVDFSLRPRPVPGKGAVQGNVWEAGIGDVLQPQTPIAGATVVLYPAGVGPDPANNDNDLAEQGEVQNLKYGDVRPNSTAANGARNAHAYKTVTDASGFYQFDGVPEGRYIVGVKAKDYRPERVQVFVNTGETTVQDFFLHRNRPIVGTLEGTVLELSADPNTDPQAGQPIADAQIIVVPRRLGENLLSTDINVSDGAIPKALDSAQLNNRERNGQRSGHGPRDPRPPKDDPNGPQSPIWGQWHARTDADGHYVIEGIPVGDYLVICMARGFFPARTPANVAEGETTVVDFALSPLPDPKIGAVTGKVVGLLPPDTNTYTRADRFTPLAGAIVMLVPVDELDRTDTSLMNASDPNAPAGPRRHRLVGVTDSQGDYAIRGVPEGRYVAVVMARGFDMQRQRVGVEAGGVAVANFRLEPLAAGRVLGLVTAAPSGQPVSQAMLVLVPLFPGGQHEIRFTDQDGAYLFDKVRPGRYSLSVVARGFNGDAQVIEAFAGEDTLVDFVLAPQADPGAEGKVFGTVWEVSSGPVIGLPVPIAGTQVTLRCATSGGVTFEEQTLTDDMGRYEFNNVPPNPCLLIFEAVDFVSFETRFLLRPGEEKRVDAYLSKPGKDTGGIAGHVGSSAEKAPISGAHILVFPDLIFIDQSILPPEPVGEAWTDPDGNYGVANLPAGDYIVRCAARGYQPAEAKTSVLPGQISDVNFALDPTGPVEEGALHGRVHVANALQPIAGAVVRVWTLPMPITAVPVPPVAEVITDSSGLYKLDKLPAGMVQVECTAFGYVKASATATIVAGAKTEQNFGLSPLNQTRKSKVFGFVLAHTNDPTFAPVPIAGALVELTSSPGPGRPPIRYYSATASATGYYEIPDVEGGDYGAVASATGYAPLSLNATVVSGHNLRLDFVLHELVPNSASVSGTVIVESFLDIPSQPIPGARVVLTAKNSPTASPVPLFLEQYTNLNGEYHFPVVPAFAGIEWNIECGKRGYESKNQDIKLAAGEHQVVNFQLKTVPITVSTSD